MADLTCDAPLRLKGDPKTERWIMDTSSAQTAYKGEPMYLNINGGDTLNVVPWHSSATTHAVDVTVGIAAEKKVVVSGDPETTEIEIYVAPSIVGFKSTVFTNADVGKAVYMTDSGTLNNSGGATGVLMIGYLFKVEDGYAYVRLITPYINTGAGA